MKRRLIVLMTAIMAIGTTCFAQTAATGDRTAPTPGTDGGRYVPYEERTGNESIVYFTRKLGPEGLIKAYEQVCAGIGGRVGVKLHTGEQHGPNIIPA